MMTADEMAEFDGSTTSISALLGRDLGDLHQLCETIIGCLDEAAHGPNPAAAARDVLEKRALALYLHEQVGRSLASLDCLVEGLGIHVEISAEHHGSSGAGLGGS